MNLFRKRGGPLERKEVIEKNEEGKMLFTSHSLTHTPKHIEATPYSE